MKAAITNTLIQKLQPKDKPYDVRDTKLTGFLVWVNISGKIVYICEYARGKRVTIGRTGIFNANDARERAKSILGEAAKGNEVNPRKKKTG